LNENCKDNIAYIYKKVLFCEFLNIPFEIFFHFEVLLLTKWWVKAIQSEIEMEDMLSNDLTNICVMIKSSFD
jgi:hypothetical protein